MKKFFLFTLIMLGCVVHAHRPPQPEPMSPTHAMEALLDRIEMTIATLGPQIKNPQELEKTLAIVAQALDEALAVLQNVTFPASKSEINAAIGPLQDARNELNGVKKQIPHLTKVNLPVSACKACCSSCNKARKGVAACKMACRKLKDCKCR